MYSNREINKMVEDKMVGGLTQDEAFDAVWNFIDEAEASHCGCEDYPCCGH